MTSISDFFADFYSTAPQGAGVVELRWISHEDEAPRRVFSDMTKVLEQQAHNWNMRADKRGVYFGVAMRKPDATTGKKEDISVVTALWTDLDVVKNGWDMKRTLGALKASPLRPSIIINSGNGYHCYWLLKHPLIIHGPGEIEIVEQAMRTLAVAFGGDPSCVDITRVLRVPYTDNKKGDKKLEVEIAVEDWQLEYFFDELVVAAANQERCLFNGEWLSKDDIKSKANDIRKSKGLDGLAGKMTKIAGIATNMSWGEVWAHTKYKPDGAAFIGIDEAILRGTAILYARFGGEWPDGKIIDDVLAEVKRIKQRDAPRETWNWTKERQEISDKLARFKDRWQETRELEQNDQTKRGGARKQRSRA